MKRIIIINPQQFGVNTDYRMYVNYLKFHYDEIKYITINQGYPIVDKNSANFTYIPYCRIKKISYALFLLYCFFYLSSHKGIVMTSNFSGCRYLKVIFRLRKMIVNIRTVSVNKDIRKSFEQNAIIRKDASVFDRIIMISMGGAKQLKLPLYKVKIVSLGADVISTIDKSFDTLKLLYVGTLSNRDIIKTVKGFHEYLIKSGDDSSTYDIIGDGEELALIARYINEQALENRVVLHGRKSYDCLKPFFDTCNIGISFVPMTEMYEYQPPTKTFEYISSGLFCLATNTQANREVISSDNGMLLQDSPEAFCHALLDLYKIRFTLSSEKIRETGKTYQWKNIIEQQLLPALDINCI